MDKTILTAVAVIAAVLISGGFAISQGRRSKRAQRELEVLRSQLASQAEAVTHMRTEAAEKREAILQYRRDQVLPFLDRLNDALTTSYGAAYLPPVFPRIGGRIPELRRYADSALSKWLSAHASMSDQRMQLMLVLSPSEIDELARQLTSLVDRMQQVLKVRQQVWYDIAKLPALWEAHRAYVTMGFRIMLDIRAAAISGDDAEDVRPLPQPTRDAISDRLAQPFEKLSTASLPYGITHAFTWLIVWELDLRPEWLESLSAANQGTMEEFEDCVKSVAKTLDQDPRVMSAQLIRVSGSADCVYALSAGLPGPSQLRDFVEDFLPELRLRFPVLWSSQREPIEFEFGLSSDRSNVS